MLRAASILLLAGTATHAQKPPDPAECLDALERSAANFAAGAPGLMSEETLDQHGRQGFIEILRGKKDEVRILDFTLPDEFHDHRVVSNYGLAEVGHPR